ncbi:MAG: sulfatase [Planctomycetaceae bacterium]
MTTRSFWCLGWLLAMGAAHASAAQPTKARPPNIIVILADDLGYKDIGAHGGTLVKTPHIDSLALNGVRCSNAYVTGPVCAPTRAGLLTGRYQQRFGLEFNPQPSGPASDLGLPLSELTLAEALKKQGYHTGMVGKWHLGGGRGLRPPERGFDEYFGFLQGAHHYLRPQDEAEFRDKSLTSYVSGVLRGLQAVDEKDYLTDAFTREALAFIDRNASQPFFLYLPYNAVHSPLEAPAKYRDRVAGVGPPRRKLYAAMLTALDDGVGAVLGKLRERQLFENTLVFFLSDNGGSPQPYNTTDNGPLSGKKGELLEGGIRVPFLVQWKGKLPAGAVYEHPVVSLDIFATAMAVAGGALPTDRVYDGVNLIPYLTGQRGDPPHVTLFWRYGQSLALRHGPWKLHKTDDYPAQLYDLRSDIGETTDLAQRLPDRVKELEAELQCWNDQLVQPLWGSMPPHERNLDWLFDVSGDPRLQHQPAKNEP